jgi:hypothetical protein
MANEVLMRRAESEAERSGEPIEEAMWAVVDTEAGKQPRELRDGPHGEESVEECQVGIARQRARERAEASRGASGRSPSIPHTADGANSLEPSQPEVRRMSLSRTRVNRGIRMDRS